jgi:hypothetical protein
MRHHPSIVAAIQACDCGAQCQGFNSSMRFLRPAVHQAGRQIGEIDLRIDAIQFAGLDQRREACTVAHQSFQQVDNHYAEALIMNHCAETLMMLDVRTIG